MHLPIVEPYNFDQSAPLLFYDSAKKYKMIPTALTALAGRYLHRYLEVLVVSLLVLERQHEEDDILKNNRAPDLAPDAIL